MNINSLKKNLLTEILETFNFRFSLYDLTLISTTKGKLLPDKENICYKNKIDKYIFECKINHCWTCEIEYIETFRYYNHDNTVQKLLTYNFNFQLKDVYVYQKLDSKKDKQ